METATYRDRFASDGYSVKATLGPVGRAHTSSTEDSMDAEYITATHAEAMQKLTAAFEAEDAAKFKYQRREAQEDQEFWGNKAASMSAAAKRIGLEL